MCKRSRRQRSGTVCVQETRFLRETGFLTTKMYHHPAATYVWTASNIATLTGPNTMTGSQAANAGDRYSFDPRLRQVKQAPKKMAQMIRQSPALTKMFRF